VKWVWPESENWLQQTLDKIKLHTDKPIVVREKPDQHIFDKAGNIIGKTPKLNSDLESDLRDAQCVVGYNSNVLTQALCQGIPVIASDASPSYFVSQDFSNINNPTEVDRQAWLHYMAYNQFNTAEFKSGEAWSILQQSL
jgi:hypothetical protein